MRQGRRELIRRVDRPGRRRAQVRFVDHRRVDRSPWPSVEPVRNGCSHEHRMHVRQRPDRSGRTSAADLPRLRPSAYRRRATTRSPRTDIRIGAPDLCPRSSSQAATWRPASCSAAQILSTKRSGPDLTSQADEFIVTRGWSVAPSPSHSPTASYANRSSTFGLSPTRTAVLARWHPFAVAARLTHPNAAPTLRWTFRSGSVTVPRPTAKESRCID